MRFSFLLATLVMLVACTDNMPTPKKAAIKTLYTHARIYTLDEQHPWAAAMVTEGENIRFVGSEENASEYIDGETQIYDMTGKFLMPGIIDAHTHPGLVASLAEDENEGSAEQKLPQDSKQSLYDFLESYGASHRLTPMIVLGEWDVNSFLPDGPNKSDLDKIFSLRPTILFDNSGHSYWANSSALTIMGIDKDTPDLSPGISYFVRDQHGEPTGWIKEFAMLPYIGNMLLPSKSELRTGMINYLSFLSNRGVTTLWDAGNFAWHDNVYEVVSELDKAGKLPLRYEGSYHIWAPNQLDTAIAEFKKLRVKYAGERLRFNTLKIHFDGVAEVLTAGMLQPYASDLDNRGGVLFSAQRLSGFINELNREGIHLHMHTVGDWATREALDAVALARSHNNDNLAIEITLSHLETVDPADIVRFKELNVHANFTPHWFGGSVFGKAGAHNLGTERASRSQVANEFVKAGANVTLSSDVVSATESYRANPFIGMQMSVTRQEYNNADGPILAPASAGLTLPDALAAYTVNGARQLGYAKQLGVLAGGAKADFIVLDQNPFEIDIHLLHRITPRATVLDGTLVAGDLNHNLVDGY